MPGPPKTPTHLALVKGNPSKRAVNKDEPKPASGVPPVPKHFDKMGKYWFTLAHSQLAGRCLTYHLTAGRDPPHRAAFRPGRVRLLGAGDELFPADARHRAARLQGELSLVGGRVRG